MPRITIAVEGCLLECATRMMKGVVPKLAPTVIIADRHYEFDRSLFGIDQMPGNYRTSAGGAGLGSGIGT